MSLCALLFLLASPLYTLVLQATGNRLFPHLFRSRQKMAIFYALLSAILSVLLAFVLEAGKSESEFLFWGFSTLVAGCLAHIQFHFFNMSETARRIHILVSLLEKKELTSKLSKKDSYSPDHIVSLRLQRLVEFGAIEKKGDRYHALPCLLLYVSLLMKRYQRLIGLEG